MKIPSAILLLSLGAVSAFGLQASPSVGNAIRSRAGFANVNQALVQPIGLDGQRLGGNDFVSLELF